MEPDEFIVLYAKKWREAEKKLIGIRTEGEGKEMAKNEQRSALRKLREAIDLANRNEQLRRAEP